jgi:SAM-dependent methyltransferase
MKELFYEQDDVWAQIPEEYQVRVRSDLLAALPRDVQSVLDAGCGDGFVANALPGDLRVTGADISLSALGHVKRDAVRCSVADLPFGDKRFDLVMCNDVLEHLFDDALARALSELERVASRYILVTVPLMENLQAQMTRCGACGAQYHVNRHCRAFGLGRLLSLFSARAIVPESIVFTGARVPAQEEVARGLRAILGMQAEWEKAICPECGARESVGCRDPERIRLVDRLASDPSFSLPSWRPDRNECMALFALGRERKRTTPKKPALRLIRIDGSRNEIEIPFALTDANGNPRLHPDSKAMSEEGALYAEWKTKRVAYRLAIEDIPEDGSIALPAWFSPGALAELESAEPERIAADSRWTRAAVGRILSLMEAEEESASGLTQLRNERDSLSLRLGQYEQLRIDLDNSFAERDALKLRIGQFEQQAVDLQNARAELDTLRLRSGQAEQQAIDLQNARAELDALRSRIGQLEQQASGLESAKAEIDALRARAGQYEQQTVELRNARAELETAHARIAEFEQRAGELRDARAELDSLRARLADLPRLSAELETAKQRLAEV